MMFTCLSVTLDPDNRWTDMVIFLVELILVEGKVLNHFGNGYNLPPKRNNLYKNAPQKDQFLIVFSLLIFGCYLKGVLCTGQR